MLVTGWRRKYPKGPPDVKRPSPRPRGLPSRHGPSPRRRGGAPSWQEGSPPFQAGGPPVDAGVPAWRAGGPPPGLGSPPWDAGSPPCHAGTPRRTARTRRGVREARRGTAETHHGAREAKNPVFACFCLNSGVPEAPAGGGEGIFLIFVVKVDEPGAGTVDFHYYASIWSCPWVTVLLRNSVRPASKTSGNTWAAGPP